MAVGAFFLVVILLGLWLVLVYTAWQQTKKQQQSEHLHRALALWPVTLIDSVVRAAGLPDWYAIVGVFHFVPVLIGAMLLHHFRHIMQPHTPLVKSVTYSLIALPALAQLPLLLQPLNYARWISNTPVAQVEQFWWVYLPYVVACGALMLIAGKMTDISRRYHTYLPWQAVDIKRYKCVALTVIAGLLLFAALVGLSVVIMVAAGMVNIIMWPVLIDLSIATILLLALTRCVLPHGVLPSPLEFQRVFSSAGNRDDVALVKRAEKVMIASKSYKVIGLTLEAFSTLAGIDPTDLVAALKRVRKQDFRGFIFHYRMEYARNVVMRSDASIASVAKRLGFHSEKFLSGPFLQYLEKRR